MKSKKGTVLDMFAISIVLLFFGIIAVVSIYVADQIFPELIGFFGTGAGVTVVKTVKQGYGTMDYIFMFLYFMLTLVPIIFASLVRHHPVFLILNILLLFIFFLVVPVFSNVMREFWQTEEFGIYAFGGGGSYTYPVMTRLFQYMPLISSAVSVIIMIAMFAKRGTGEL